MYFFFYHTAHANLNLPIITNKHSTEKNMKKYRTDQQTICNEITNPNVYSHVNFCLFTMIVLLLA